MVKITDVPIAAPQFQRGLPVGGSDYTATAQGAMVESGGKNLQVMEREAEERDAKIYLAQQKAKLNFEQLQRLEEMKVKRDNVTGFTKEYLDDFQKSVDNIVENAPNRLAADAFRLDSESIRESLGTKAMQFEATQKIELNKVALKDAINNRVNTVLLAPDDFNQIAADARAEINAASGFMTPVEFEDFKASSEGLLAEAKVRAEIKRNPDVAEQLLKEDAYKSALTPDKTFTLMNAIDRRREDIKQEAAAAAERFTKLYKDDPAQLAMENGANPNDPEHMLEVQTSLGVTPGNFSLINKQEASLQASKLNGVTNADIMVGEMKALRQKYGRNLPIALRDLKKNGLSSSAAFIVMMNPDEDKSIIEAATAISRSGAKEVVDLAKATAASEGDKFSDIENNVTRNLLDYNDILMSEGFTEHEINNVRATSNDVAAYFYQRSRDPVDAAKRATSWLVDNYEPGEVNGQKFRVPLDYAPDTVEESLETILQNLTSKDIEIEGDEKFMVEDIKRNGFWVLNNEETGYTLLQKVPGLKNTGVPVRWADGKSAFEITFPEISHIYQENRKISNKKASASTAKDMVEGQKKWDAIAKRAREEIELE